MMKFSLFLIFFYSLTILGQQSFLDSLENVVKTQSGKEKVVNLGELCYQYSFKDSKKAISFGLQSVKEALKTKDSTLIANAYNDLSIGYFYKGDLDSSIINGTKSLNIRQAQGDSIGVAKSLSKIATSNYELGNMQLALKDNLRAIAIFDRNELEQYTGQILTNIGNIYDRNGNQEEALKFMQKSSEIALKYNDYRSYIVAQGNVANTLQKIGKEIEAEQVFLGLISIIDTSGTPEMLATVYQGLGVNYRNRGMDDKGAEYYEKALKIYKEMGSESGISLIDVNLGLYYLEQNKIEKAEVLLLEGLKYGQSTNSFYQLKHAYQGLARLESIRGNFEKSDEYFDLFINYMDSVYNNESNQAISEMQVKYDTEKKEQEIALKNAKLREEQLKVKQKNYWLFGLGTLLLLMLVLAFSVYRQQKLKQKSLIKENKLKEQVAEEQLKNELHEERLRISRDLHDNIGSQLTFIISSVDNMQFLFKSSDEKLKDKLTKVSEFTRTTIAQLRDTIWAMNKDQISLEDLKRRLFNYIEKAKVAQNNIEFIFEMDAHSTIYFNSTQGIGMFRIVQEAINNSLKYSSASKITCSIKEDEKHIYVAVTDDGIGFKISHVNLGNGLNNMYLRAKNINAKLTINSSQKEGTAISLIFEKDKLNAV